MKILYRKPALRPQSPQLQAARIRLLEISHNSTIQTMSAQDPSPLSFRSIPGRQGLDEFLPELPQACWYRGHGL